MTPEKLRSITFEVASKTDRRFADPEMSPAGKWLEHFALHFLAAVQERAEPVASVIPCHVPSGKRVALYSEYQDLPLGTQLFTHPSFEQRNGGQTSERTDSQESPAVERCAAHPVTNVLAGIKARKALRGFFVPKDLLDLIEVIEANHPEPAPQQEADTRKASDIERCSPVVGAAPLPDDVKALVERLRDYINDVNDVGSRVDAADMIERLAANRVPEGMVLVPVEPTEAMINLGTDAIYDAVGRRSLACYKAMIAAGEVNP